MSGSLVPEMLEVSQENVMDAMWFYDDLEELEEWQTLRREAQQVEKEHLEIRVALRDAETALRAAPGNEDLGDRVQQLKEKLAELEKRAPWISADVPLEILLWGVPHG